jgi:hypothetical protein
LQFNEVFVAEGVDSCVDDLWLYEELHQSDQGVELNVLLECGELKIVARRLMVNRRPA